MKSQNKIYSLFIVITLLFWNPLSYLLIYGNTPIYTEKVSQLFYWIVFIGGLLLIFLNQKNILNDRIKNVIFALAITGILFSTLVIVDRAFGLVSMNDAVLVQNQELSIFEPNSKARYKTVEFDFIAKINSLGLRNREINLDKGEMYRILCFGDSWTYGYGVNIEDSWPQVLQQYLITNGFENIEVINCGRPGQFTGTYKMYMENIVPLLKPDLVLVGVLQLDDLAQIYTNNFRFDESSIIKTVARKIIRGFQKYFESSFKNILPSPTMLDVTSNWEKISTSKISDFNFWQKLRFSTLHDSVQSLFKSGNLEPSFLDYYINYPDRITIFNNKNHPATEFAIKEMNKDFKKMANICYKNSSKLIFINIPMYHFTGHKVIRTPNDILNPYFEKNNNIDHIYRSIAKANNLSYIEMTNHFIGLENKSDYFFKYDGHPNETGYAEMAKYIGKQLIEKDYLN